MIQAGWDRTAMAGLGGGTNEPRTGYRDHTREADCGVPESLQVIRVGERRQLDRRCAAVAKHQDRRDPGARTENSPISPRCRREAARDDVVRTLVLDGLWNRTSALNQILSDRSGKRAEGVGAQSPDAEVRFCPGFRGDTGARARLRGDRDDVD